MKRIDNYWKQICQIKGGEFNQWHIVKVDISDKQKKELERLVDKIESIDPSYFVEHYGTNNILSY